jgi:hypothetical protein
VIKKKSSGLGMARIVTRGVNERQVAQDWFADTLLGWADQQRRRESIRYGGGVVKGGGWKL